MLEVSEGEQVEEPAYGPSLEDLRLVERAMQVMSENDQSLLVPYFLYQYSAQDIADALGIQRHTVHERIRNALRRTRAKLEEKA